MTKSIFSLNCSNSVGKLMGKWSVNEHVDTVGKTPLSLNTTLDPNGGTESQPVRKTMTSRRVGIFYHPELLG